MYVSFYVLLLTLRYFVMSFYPPELQFTINVTIEQRQYLTKNGSGVWKEISTLAIGPHKRIASSDSHIVINNILQHWEGELRIIPVPHQQFSHNFLRQD